MVKRLICAFREGIEKLQSTQHAFNEACTFQSIRWHLNISLYSSQMRKQMPF